MQSLDAAPSLPGRRAQAAAGQAAATQSPAPQSSAAQTSSLQPAAPQAAARGGTDYAQLSRQIRQAGLLERRPWYYTAKISVTVLLLAAGWAAFVLLGNSWWQLAVAAFLAVMFTQVGFLGHDAGHRQIFGSRQANYVLGVLLGNLGIGLSYGWWVSKHNRHHAHPNQEGETPTSSSACSPSPSEAGRARGFPRQSSRFQAFLFFPCCCWRRSACTRPASGR